MGFEQPLADTERPDAFDEETRLDGVVGRDDDDEEADDDEEELELLLLPAPFAVVVVVVAPATTVVAICDAETAEHAADDMPRARPRS